MQLREEPFAFFSSRSGHLLFLEHDARPLKKYAWERKRVLFVVFGRPVRASRNSVTNIYPPLLCLIYAELLPAGSHAEPTYNLVPTDSC